MNLNWISTPLAIYGSVALSLMAILFLSLTFKREVSAVRRNVEKSHDTAAADLHEMQACIKRLQEKVTEIGDRPMQESTPLNAGRRLQALRMHRRGESVETIAAALKTPRNEVELLVKVVALTEQHSGSPAG